MPTRNLNIQLDFRSGLPIYIQIMEQIRQRVASGDLQQGDQLPTVRQLATDLRINWNTVARAYKYLDEAGLISTQQGRGTYIWEAPSEETTQHLRRESLEGLTKKYLAEAKRLGYTSYDVKLIFEEFYGLWEAGDSPEESE